MHGPLCGIRLSSVHRGRFRADELCWGEDEFFLNPGELEGFLNRLATYCDTQFYTNKVIRTPYAGEHSTPWWTQSRTSMLCKCDACKNLRWVFRFHLKPMHCQLVTTQLSLRGLLSTLNDIFIVIIQRSWLSFRLPSHPPSYTLIHIITL